LLAGALTAVFLLESLFASLGKSPTFDEPAHIAAGLSYWQTGRIAANPQHPPLLKELGGLALLAAGVRLPDTPLVRNMERGVPGTEYAAGSALLRDLGPERTLFWARLPFILLAAAAGLLLFAWGRQLASERAAVGALFLYAFSPTILAHSFLVTTDVGLAAFTLLFFFALWSYLRCPSWKRMLWCGAAMGAVLAVKFSAVALPPIGLLLLWASLRWPPDRLPGSPRAFWESTGGGSKVPAAGKNDPCPCGSGKKYKVCHGARPASASGSQALPSRAPTALQQALRCALVFLTMCGVALVVVEACYFFPSDWLAYLNGLRRVNADHDPNYLALLGGQLGKHFLSYFAAVWLLKEPLASLILAALGAVALVRSKTVGTLAKLFLLLPPAVLFAGYSLAAEDLGVRYLIPILPFAYLVAGWGLAGLVERRAWWSRATAAALCLWIAIEAAGIYPDHLSYFNELACLPSHAGEIGADGGSRCGPLWLDDHNVDWGQGLRQLKTWMDAHAAGRPWKLAYFGFFPPEAYGLKARKIGQQELAMAQTPEPGLYAVSAHLVARVPPLGERFFSGGTGGRPGARPGPIPGAWLRTVKPVAIVGHAFYIYDIPGGR